MKSYGFCTVAELILLALALNNAAAANRWFSARTINRQTQPLSAGTESIIMPDGRMASLDSATVSNGRTQGSTVYIRLQL